MYVLLQNFNWGLIQQLGNICVVLTSAYCFKCSHSTDAFECHLPTTTPGLNADSDVHSVMEEEQLVSLHRSPIKPGEHKHWNDPKRFEQVPFTHGEETHSSTSNAHSSPVKPLGHSQRVQLVVCIPPFWQLSSQARKKNNLRLLFTLIIHNHSHYSINCSLYFSLYL